jgi:two-component system nitrate/nitrite response regulator NarL
MLRQRVATVLVGPSAFLREGLTRILGTSDCRIVASAACVDDLVLTALPRHRSILLIIDAGDDLQAAAGQVELFKGEHPAARVAVVADHNQPRDIVSAFRAGANAYFTRIVPCNTFMKSLELVMLGETILPAAILPMLLDDADHDDDDHEDLPAVNGDGEAVGEFLEAEGGDTPRLSVREKSILNCLIEGDSNKTIGRKINIAEATVKVHVKAILRKIRVRNRTQAAIWAMSNGWSAPSMANDASAPAAAAIHPPLAPHIVRALPLTQLNGSGASIGTAPHAPFSVARGSRKTLRGPINRLRGNT